MQLKLFRHLWGVFDPWQEAFPRFVKKGYQGIETKPTDDEKGELLRKLLDEHKLELIAQLQTVVDRPGPSVDAQVEQFGQKLREAAAWSPVMVSCHAGADCWALPQAMDFFRQALEIEKEVGVPVAHETHRGRYFFNPWNTRDVLAELPDLKLCVDFSHWVVVCERLMDDQLEIIRQAAERTIHVHARVGFGEGPQVPDPAANIYADALAAHERWWDLVWASQSARQMDVSTLTPEFGPPMYHHIDPATETPLTDLETVCDWVADRQARRFTKAFG